MSSWCGPGDSPLTDPKYWKLGIVGWPLGYSLSPLMHNAALKAAGLQGEYKEYKLEPDSRGGASGEMFRDLIEPILRKHQLDGFNVTMPYKKGAYNWIFSDGTLGEPKGLLGNSVRTINTVKLDGDKPVGHNTDIEGFLLPLIERNADLSNNNAILLGAGGAAEAIAATLGYKTKAKRLTIWTRTYDAAKVICDRINAPLKFHQDRDVFSLPARNADELPIKEAKLIVNATPAGMKGEPDLPLDYSQLHEGQVVYDIVYEPRETRLIREARARGCETITGDEMLAAQAAASFELWTGVKGMLPVMREALGEYFATHG